MWEAFGQAVEQHEKDRAWTTTHEMLATAVELLHGIQSDLRAGVPVLMAAKRANTSEPMRWPRPDWIEEPKATQSGGGQAEVVVSPRDLATMLRRTG